MDKNLSKSTQTQARRDFFKAIAQGLIDVREGRTVSVDEARKRLGLVEER